MMPVALTSTFTIKSYTIRQQPLFDNPHLAIFLIFLRGALIGRQISYPCLTDCQWHERRAGVYATARESHYTIVNYRRRGRPRKSAAAWGMGDDES